MTAVQELLEFTGERLVPEKADNSLFWEHVYRYRFATRFARGRRVLDVACGEGYGSRALELAGARSVIGMDISEEACAHARRRYGVDARVGDAECLPLPDRCVDLIVSFETIEHVPRPETFLRECDRVLDRGGVLLVSTPNRPAYQAIVQNPFHCSELSESEFLSLLSGRFDGVELYDQCPMAASRWSTGAWVAKNSPWNHVRGVWRLKSWFCPWVFGGDESARRPAVEAILGRDRPGSGWVNPHLLRRRGRRRHAQPLYLVAVARKNEGPS